VTILRKTAAAAADRRSRPPGRTMTFSEFQQALKGDALPPVLVFHG